MREVISLEGVAERILSVSPSGLKIYDLQEAPIESSPLQTLVRSAEYRVRFVDEYDPSELQQKINTLLSQERIIKIHIRKNKKHVTDLRPMIHGLALDEDNHLIAHLATGGQGNVRIEDVIEELGMQGIHYNAHRYKLHVEAYR